MQICHSIIGGKPVKSNLPVIEKRYPATGEVITHIEPASDAMLKEAFALLTLPIKPRLMPTAKSNRFVFSCKSVLFDGGTNYNVMQSAMEQP